MQASASDSGAGAGGSQAELYQAQAHVEGAQEGEPFLYRLFVGWVRGVCVVSCKKIYTACASLTNLINAGRPVPLSATPPNGAAKHLNLPLLVVSRGGVRG